MGAVVALALGLAGCSDRRAGEATAAPAETAAAFVQRMNTELRAVDDEVAAAGWVQATYITPDTQALNARAQDRQLAWFSHAAEDAKRYDGQSIDPSSARSLLLLKLSLSAPAPADAAKRTELAELTTRLDAMYGEAKGCHDENGKPVCANIDVLSDVLATSRDYQKVTQAWVDWHDAARPMRAPYERFATLANEGARELGFADLGAMWRSNYDMSPEQFVAEVDRLWVQVKPLYDALHCYARARLAKRYGEDKVPAGKPIPAQLLGNLWAQDWSNVYDDLLQPFPKTPVPLVDGALKSQGYDAVRMARSAESFYTSLGFPPLPQTFWERSMLVRPRDREVLCHASAWHMDGREDVRIKQCAAPNEEELRTLYHEMGHLYYDLSYKDQPTLFQGAAHEGFHEAIGDTVVLSMTPAYLAKIGLAPPASPSREAMLNQQMKMAAKKVAVLPFTVLVDRWRWQVFSGETKPAQYNAAWWSLREKYQGVSAPVPRSEQDFDPGAKYHIPGNTSYTRYFLATILQFQFHRAMCQAAGFTGPLNECSVFGNAEAGRRFRAMLAEGASKPWPETLEKLTGSREMDASAIIEYFQPLMAWLAEQNATQKCGWTS